VPVADGLPDWPAYDAERRPAMVFDAETRVEDDWRGETRRFWQPPPLPESPLG
jgi:para-nitrobenzyl esterase